MRLRRDSRSPRSCWTACRSPNAFSRCFSASSRSCSNWTVSSRILSRSRTRRSPSVSTWERISSHCCFRCSDMASCWSASLCIPAASSLFFCSMRLNSFSCKVWARKSSFSSWKWRFMDCSSSKSMRSRCSFSMCNRRCRSISSYRCRMTCSCWDRCCSLPASFVIRSSTFNPRTFLSFSSSLLSACSSCRCPCSSNIIALRSSSTFRRSSKKASMFALNSLSKCCLPACACMDICANLTRSSSCFFSMLAIVISKLTNRLDSRSLSLSSASCCCITLR
mmetsp:Transcript_45363/g.81171  ORF Transcript_45363/g.81171 Transcript_45363/m.81171 type:complete len:279 (+) Transcript_45363:3221-4057(+)